MHSVLIPHRNRNGHLELCLWSLRRSALACGIADSDWEAVVADSGSAQAVSLFGTPGRIVEVPMSSCGIFNKCACLNAAMDAAGATTGDVLTFLDADAVVGPLFLGAAGVLDDPALTRCCYRVRYLPAEEEAVIRQTSPWELHVDGLVRRFNEQNDKADVFRLGFEAYGNHHRSRPNGEPWGNSQFSVRRESLGDLRFDEAFIGHGTEDLDFNCRCEVRWGKTFRGHIWTDGDHAMFHLEHPIEQVDWRTREITNRNHNRYRNRRKELMGR